MSRSNNVPKAKSAAPEGDKEGGHGLERELARIHGRLEKIEDKLTALEPVVERSKAIDDQLKGQLNDRLKTIDDRLKAMEKSSRELDAERKKELDDVRKKVAF
jgi:hypothetical protein